MNKTLILLVFFLMSIARNIIAMPAIEEPKIPIPEVPYELPEALIGEFIMVSPFYELNLAIYPNNKFVLQYYVPDHILDASYGYVIKKDNTWYLSCADKSGTGYVNSGLAEIYLTDTGFLYYTPKLGILRAIRKENIPAPKQLAREVTISERMVKQQYFSFHQLDDKIALEEIEFIDVDYRWYHKLCIDNGIVKIRRYIDDDPMHFLFARFDGFMETIEETADSLKGIIQFTNGPPFYHIDDGTADIEIKNDGSIIITMLYNPNPYLAKEKAIFDKFQWPAKLTLEF